MLIEAFELNGRKFAVSEPGRPLSDNDLSRFEDELGVRLPHQLRSFYLRWNGGLPIPLDLPERSSMAVVVCWPAGSAASASGRRVSLHDIQSFDSEVEDFMQNREAYRAWIPADLLPFQRDPGSGQFLIGTGAINLGRIFYWPPGYGPDLEAGEFPSYDNIATVAPSFLEFLALYRDSERLPGESEDDWIRRNYGDI